MQMGRGWGVGALLISACVADWSVERDLEPAVEDGSPEDVPAADASADAGSADAASAEDASTEDASTEDASTDGESPDDTSTGADDADSGSEQPDAGPAAGFPVSPANGYFVTLGQERRAGPLSISGDGFEEGPRVCTGNGRFCVSGSFGP